MPLVAKLNQRGHETLDKYATANTRKIWHQLINGALISRLWDEKTIELFQVHHWHHPNDEYNDIMACIDKKWVGNEKYLDKHKIMDCKGSGCNGLYAFYWSAPSNLIITDPKMISKYGFDVSMIKETSPLLTMFHENGLIITTKQIELCRTCGNPPELCYHNSGNELGFDRGVSPEDIARINNNTIVYDDDDEEHVVF